MKDINRYIPVDFEKIEEFQANDERFIKVKIWLMHLGQNFNGSYFAKEPVELAIPTLANTPILCYLETNSNGEDDFSDHRSRLKRKENGEIEWEYMGQAIGVIPETNNAKFEFKVCDDGVTREFLTCEGLVWTKWDKPLEIFNRDVVKSESMEIHKSFEGYWDDEDGLFHFEKFKFFGACALGFDVLPAMSGATIEAQFSVVEFKKQIQEKMEEYKSYCKGGQKLEERLALLEKFSITKEQLEEKGINFETIELKDLEVELENFQTEPEVVEPEVVPEVIEPEVIVPEVVDKFTAITFKISHEDIRDKLYQALRPAEENNDTWYYIFRVYDNYFEYEDGATSQYYKQSYMVENDMLQLNGDKVEVFMTMLTKEEISALDTEKQQFQALTTEVEDLRQYKNTKEEFERQKEADARKADENEIFSSFDEQLEGIEEYTELKSKSSEFSLEDLRIRCYAIFGEKTAKFSVKKSTKNDKNVKYSFDAGKDNTPKTSNKPYQNIIEKYKK